jgi:CRISPR/Cas system-associated exonuclease Cas4 (RecB family)
MGELDEDVLAAMGVDQEDVDDLSGVGDLQISLADSVDAAIEDHITSDEDGESERHKARVGVYHASGAARCIRKRWYGAKGVVKPERHEFPAGIAHRGNVVEDEVEESLLSRLHDNLVDDLQQDLADQLAATMRVGNEYPVSHEVDWPDGSFYITGSTDPYVEDGDGNLIEVIEVKSANSPPDEPKWYHEFQLNTYLSALGLETGVIVYIDPSNWDNREVFVYQQDEALWELTKLYHGVFHHYRVEDKLPPKLPIGEDECIGCPYAGLCRRDDRGDEYLQDTFPPDHSADRANIWDQR